MKAVSQTETFSDVGLEIIRASEITPKEVKWLWYPYFPFGKVIIIQGDPGCGKSKFMLTLSALLSKGKTIPFSDDDEVYEPMTIIYQTTEDDADDTVVPRFIESDGDPYNLIFIREDKKSLTFGDSRIKEAIVQHKAKLLILDPFSSYIGDGRSLNQANEMRAEFNYLISVGRETGCCIVIIAHMNKMEGINPVYRTSGSIDIVGAARGVLAVVKTDNKQNPDERVLVQVKSNLAPTGSAILFETTEGGINFIDEIELTAEEAFSAIAPQMGRPNEKCDEAVTLIRKILADGKWHDATECINALKAAGIKESTYKKAKKKLGVECVKPHSKHRWRLQEVAETDDGQEVDDDDLSF